MRYIQVGGQYFGHVFWNLISEYLDKFNLIIQNKTWRFRYDMIMTIVDL